jgi:Fic family protein
MNPYVPEELPFSDIDYRRHIRLVGESNAELARLDRLLQGLQQPEILLSPLVNEEAVLSSRIEGTQTTLTEILEYDADKKTSRERQDDIQKLLIIAPL